MSDAWNERLRLIRELQADGFNLKAIDRLLSASGESAGRLVDLREALAAPFENETPEVVTAAELSERFGEVDARDAERIRKLKLVTPLGDDRFEVSSPALLKAAEEVVALGISLHAAINAVAAAVPTPSSARRRRASRLDSRPST